MHCEPPPITFIPCEEHFRPVLPTIEGNVDYLALRGQLTTMDELLSTSGVENEFVRRSLEHWIKTLSESARDGEKIRQIRRFESRIVKWPVFVAKTHKFLAVMFRYGLSSGSWNLQL